MKTTSKEKPYILLFGILCAFIVVSTLISFVQKKSDSQKVYMYVGKDAVSLTEFNFYYTTLVNTYHTTYQSAAEGLGLNINSNLKEQECPIEGYGTWDDFFTKAAADTIQNNHALLYDAENSKFSYNCEKDWNSFYEQILKQADTNGLTVTNMVKKMYGNSASISDIKRYFKQYITSNKYVTYLRENTNVPEEELEQEYKENSWKYDKVTYLMYDVKADITEKDDEESIKTAMTDAQTTAKSFFDSVYDEETFLQEAKKRSGLEDISVIHSNEEYDEVDASISDWLFKCEKKGQMVYIKDTYENCFHVVYFISRERDDSLTATIRQILISPSSALGTYLPNTEDYEKAFNEASELYNNFLSGDKTEESFSKLATSESDDIGTKDLGGLIDDVRMGQFETEMDKWIFDSREPGDTGIVKTIYGYHLLYFVDYDDPVWKKTLSLSIKQQKLDKYIEELTTNYAITYP